MALPFHNSVTLKGFHFEDFHLTVNLSGLNAVTDSRTVVGKAVTIDPTAANTFKLAGDDDKVYGRLATFENRTGQSEGIVGAVAFKFASTLPIATGAVFAVGDTAIGAGNGEVKPRRNAGDTANESDHNDNFVAAIEGTNVVVVKL